ncbi:MAG: hypothetical protein ACJA1H_001083, partial [Glaciecola sp.]
MEYRYFYTKITLVVLSLLTVITSCTQEDSNTISGATKVALREAGNQLLLRNLDSTSLILPVKELEPYRYRISFEKPLSFEPS